LGIIFLFIGVAVQPGIATIQPESIDRDYVKITIDVCGLPWVKPQTKQLSREQAAKVDILFDSIDERLDKVKTMEETKAIFNDAVIELDKCGLLGGLSVKHAQRLVTEGFQNLRIMKLLNKKHKNHNSNNQIDNSFCSIVGHNISECWFIRPIHRLMDYYGFIGFLLQSIFLLGELKIPAIFSDIAFGGGGIWFEDGFEAFPSKGWINTIGSFGKQSYNGSFYGNIKAVHGYGGPAMMIDWDYYVGVTGFTGFRIWKYINITEGSYIDFLGFTFIVKIGSEPNMGLEYA